jgi:hypothetical protein
MPADRCSLQGVASIGLNEFGGLRTVSSVWWWQNARKSLLEARFSGSSPRFDGWLPNGRNRRSAADGGRRGVWVKMPHSGHSRSSARRLEAAFNGTPT